MKASDTNIHIGDDTISIPLAPWLRRPAPRSAVEPAGEYLSVGEAAKLIGISIKTLRNWMYEGNVEKGVHWFRERGSHPKFKRATLVAWIEQRNPNTTSDDRAPEGRAFVGLQRVDRQRRHA